jgi:hypothetical protein
MEDPPRHPEVAAIFTRLLAELGLSGNQLAKIYGVQVVGLAATRKPFLLEFTERLLAA